MDFNFTEAHVHEACFTQSRVAAARSTGKGAACVRLPFSHRLSVEMAMILDDYFEMESCIRLDTSCE